MSVRIVQLNHAPVETRQAFDLINKNFTQSRVWGDAMAPTFGAAAGSSAPGDLTLAVADPADATLDVHVLGFNENTEDSVYCSIQIDHDLLVPESGSIVVVPHVHFTFVSEPDAGQTVIFKMGYVYAKPGAQFQANPIISTAETYTTSAGITEVRKHLITPFPNVIIPVADCGPSMIMVFTLKLDTTSTIANGVAAVMSLDWHYEKGPLGTDSEYGP